MAATTARMDGKKWRAIEMALIDWSWISMEQGREIVTEMDAAWATIEQQAAYIEALEAAGETLLGSTDRAPVTALERDMEEQLKAAKANIKIVLDSAARRDARLQHAHDAAGALYKAASLVLDPDTEKGDTLPNIITWFRDLKVDEDDTDIDTGCEALQHVIERLTAALDPTIAAAALREVQRRDTLDSQIAALRAEVTGLRRERENLLGQLNEAATSMDERIALTREEHDLYERGVQAGRDAERRARPVLTEEAARAWARRLVGDGSCGVRFITELVGEALEKAARGEWAAPPAVSAEDLDAASRAPCMRCETGENTMHTCEAAQPSGLMLNLEPVAHDTAEMAVTTGESWPANTIPEIKAQYERLRQAPAVAARAKKEAP